MSKLAKALTAAAGNAAGESLYVEDVFSTFLFTAKSGTTDNGDMVNNINLADEGGMVWIKDRTEAYSHSLIDTERGNTKRLKSDSTAAESDTGTNGLLAFNTDGFELGTGGGAMWGRDTGNNEVATWTFRKAEKFFDVVTWTGDGSTKTHSHNLGSTPAVIIVKRTDSTSDWHTYHKDATDGVRSGANLMLYLNNTNPATYLGIEPLWAATDSTFTTVGGGNFNASGGTYVAYLFASDAGGFGDDGSESIIKCGSVATNWAAVEVNLGFEPQFVIAKVANRTDPFRIFDNMRGVVTGGTDALLRADESYYEDQGGANDYIDFTSTGFVAKSELVYPSELIYIAIRRPMKTPESGTEVFSPNETSSNQFVTTGFPVDLQIGQYTGGGDAYWVDRLRGMSTSTTGSMQYLRSTSTNAEASNTGSLGFNGFVQNGFSHTLGNFTQALWSFKRATGFFDVVAYTGTGSARTIAHNLGVAPSMVVIKRRNGSGYSWPTWHSGYSLYSTPSYNSYMNLNRDSAVAADATLWNSTLPTESVFSVGSSSETNQNNGTYVAYLFGEVAGVSKFGSYTGTGSNIDIDCGFSAGARFILIKRLTPGAGDWFVFDTARGIVAGNDPYLYLNSTAAENTGDYIDPLASGFTITSGAFWLNLDTYKYIFWAIA